MEEDSDWLFSFESVCEVLGFDPQYVRQGLVRWKQSKLVERPKAKIYRLHPPVKREKRMVKLSLEAGLRLRKAVSL